MSDLHTQRDRLREKIADDGPALELAQGGERRRLLARTVRHPVHERLHQRRPDDVDRYRPKGVRPLGESKFAAPDLARGGRIALEIWARNVGADHGGKAA